MRKFAEIRKSALDEKIKTIDEYDDKTLILTGDVRVSDMELLKELGCEITDRRFDTTNIFDPHPWIHFKSPCGKSVRFVTSNYGHGGPLSLTGW